MDRRRETPTERLQDAWCGDPCLKESEPRWYDVFFTTVYATHFVTGLTIAAVLWVRNRAEWIKWMRRYVLINFGALVDLHPLPDGAAVDGVRGGLAQADVTRITSRGWHDIGLGRIDLILQGVGNPVAAMPSLHAGITFLIAIYGIQRLRSPWRWLLALYPLAMSTALVYLAEHYVIDMLAGALLATVVLVGCQLWENSRDRSAWPGAPMSFLSDIRKVSQSPSEIVRNAWHGGPPIPGGATRDPTPPCRGRRPPSSASPPCPPR